MGTIQQSWAELGALTDSQVRLAGWNKNVPTIGDTKKLKFILDGEEINIVMELVGINHDELADGSSHAHFTFLCNDVYLKHKMNDEATNEGGWEKSEMRRWLNNDVFNALPDELKDTIKTVRKFSDTGGNGALNSTHDEIWIPSYDEVGFGKSPYAIDGQGEVYPVFTDNESRKKKYGGSSSGWWLRSAYTNNGYSFWRVYSGGYSSGNGYYAYFASGVVFGFCI